VCQPLAISPPKTDACAACGSTWKGCGSNWRAKATISSSVTEVLPSSNTCPGWKSSKVRSGIAAAYGYRDLHGTRKRSGQPA
jgi:hypothetical protein